jgi:hypothetical protein
MDVVLVFLVTKEGTEVFQTPNTGDVDVLDVREQKSHLISNMVFLASHQSKSSSADPLAQIVTCGVLN